MDFADSVSLQLTDLLRVLQHRIVFAESCTAGLISASMARIPGVSEVLAGSAVVYQLATKTQWLNVESSLLQDPGPVSEIVSHRMATGALQITPHASIAASVTGHLGPDAPADLDGLAWSTVALRNASGIVTESRSLDLDVPTSRTRTTESDAISLRHRRQQNAVRLVLEFCCEVCRDQTGGFGR
ncbi:MAG: CinA family protein [Planctomycetaceae bacterium]